MKKQNFITQLILCVVAVFFAALVLYPFLLVVSVSLSSESAIQESGYKLIPSAVDFAAYRYVFKNPASIINAYAVTALFSVISTILGTLLMGMLAYPLTKTDLKGRNIINFGIFFTMLFNGGLVPTYILITQYLHLNNTIWVYILPMLIVPWYVFMMRQFFSGIPGSICESALIDGAGEFRIFFKIIIPLSTPVVAAIALFVLLAKWNDWFTAMLYIDDQKLVSLQYLLQRIMNNIEQLQSVDKVSKQMISVKDIPGETARMAMVIVVAGPALVVFPFFQKYFTKGLVVGGVKG